MRLVLKYASLIALSLIPTTLHAQTPLGPSWETYVTLTRADLDMIRATVFDQIRGKKRGTAANWANPESGNSGTITLLNISSRNGRRCEQIEYRNIPPNKTPFDRFVLTSCLQPDGSWKLS